VVEALYGGPLKAGTLAAMIGEKKGAPLNRLLYGMQADQYVTKLQESPPLWGLAQTADLSILDAAATAAPNGGHAAVGAAATLHRAPLAANWVCDACTFANLPRAPACAMCKQHRAGNHSTHPTVKSVSASNHFPSKRTAWNAASSTYPPFTAFGNVAAESQSVTIL
jgi:hypothetical protein